LFHRISIFPILVPSLGERTDDIPLLANSFLKRVAGERMLRLSPAAISALKQRSYSGNIRELRNLVERATILVDGDEIGERHFHMPATAPIRQEIEKLPLWSGAFVLDALLTLEEVERRYISWESSRFEGDRSALAACLGLSPRTLYRKLRGAIIDES